MFKRSLRLLVALLLVLSLFPAIALGTVSCELSVDTAKVGESISVSGMADADTWVSIKVVDSGKNIIVYDAVKSTGDGKYHASFIIPAAATGTLTVVSGYGDNVAIKALQVTSGGGGGGGSRSSAPSDPIQDEEDPSVPGVVLNDIAGHWAQDSIKKLVGLGAISGFPDGSFQPDQNMTRAQFVTVLVKALGLEAEEGKVFADSAGHWAQEYIGIAAALEIVNGYNEDQFGMEDVITREQMAVIIVKAAGLGKVSDAKQFMDADKISSWAKDAVDTASSKGIITGYPDNSFRPQGYASRAEAVTVLARVLEL
ncbi:MAG: S-layer homology domain-containing protein [Syntrophomonadaceae bacterium]|jgi:hypothetical protein|nr:S-layer homology domain-containing protein [Syntrophomonadaceae bacterium]